jgi:hypothetical protein
MIKMTVFNKKSHLIKLLFDSSLALNLIKPIWARFNDFVLNIEKLKPRYLITTDLTFDPGGAVRVYEGRYQVEVNSDEAKELGLGHYQGRSGQGVRRWPLFLSFAQMVLKFIATGLISVSLPQLNWSWYTQENTVGQVRRRLIELCRPPNSRTKTVPAIQQLSLKGRLVSMFNPVTKLGTTIYYPFRYFL